MRIPAGGTQDVRTSPEACLRPTDCLAEPGELLRFLVARLDEAQEIVPAVDKALAAVIR